MPSVTPSQPDPETLARPRASLQFAIYVGFFFTGIANALLGPILTPLSLKMGVPDIQAGSLFAAQFAASSIAATIAIYNLRYSLRIGFALMAAGAATLAFSSWTTAHLAVSLIGFGLGLVIPASNILVAGNNAVNRGSRLSFLNLIWGIGAFSAPLLSGLLVFKMGLSHFLLLLSVALVVMLLFFCFRAPDIQNDFQAEKLVVSEPFRFSFARITLSLMFFLYIGIEQTIGGWAAAYSHHLQSSRTIVSALVVSCFWGALLFGRAISPMILLRVSEPSLHFIAMSLAAIGILGLLFVSSIAQISTALVLVGLGLSPIFPLNVSLLSSLLSKEDHRGSGWVFALGGLGGAALPWLTGHLSASFDSMRTGFCVPAIGILVLLGLTVGYDQWISKTVLQDVVPESLL